MHAAVGLKRLRIAGWRPSSEEEAIAFEQLSLMARKCKVGDLIVPEWAQFSVAFTRWVRRFDSDLAEDKKGSIECQASYGDIDIE